MKARDDAAITGRELGELRSVTNAPHQQMDDDYDGDGWPPPRGMALRTRATSLPPGTQRVMHRLTAVWELR